MFMLSSRLSNCTLISHTRHWPTLSMSRSSWIANRRPRTLRSANPLGTCFLGRLPVLCCLERYSGGTGNPGGCSILVKRLSPCFLPKNTCLILLLKCLMTCSGKEKSPWLHPCPPTPCLQKSRRSSSMPVLRNWKSRPIATSCWGVPCPKRRWFRQEPCSDGARSFVLLKPFTDMGLLVSSLSKAVKEIVCHGWVKASSTCLNSTLPTTTKP